MLPLHNLDAPPERQLPFAIGSFDSIGPLSKADFAHRHTFYEIVYVTDGAGAHVVDLAERPLCPPHLWVIVPGQVHYWKRVTGLRGRVLVLNDDFLLAHPADREALQALGERPLPPLELHDATDLAVLVDAMQREYREGQPGYAAVLQSYLHILLIRALRIPGIGALPTPPASRAAELAQQFVRMIAIPDGPRRTVSKYASLVGVSVSYLNDVVRQVTGRTPGQLIRRVQMLEAKRLLVRTDLSVVQVARELGFADPAYFCRFFRREAGQSPGDFRRNSP